MPHKPRLSTQTPRGDNVLEVARAWRDELRQSDRKVCDVVLADPKRILNATVAETAAWAGVSQPTVIRFCMAIGCEGFQDFKLRLAHSLALGTPATHSVILETDSTADIAAKIFDYTITSLDWVRRCLDPQAIGQAVDMLDKATRIEFFGFGASGIVARDAQQKFPLFGVPCGAETDSHQQVMQAATMKPGAVLVAISNTAATRSLVDVAALVRRRGCKVIGIVGTDGPLTSECDVVITVETLENTHIYTPTISRIAALTVIDVLSTAVALRRPDRADALGAMKQRLSIFRAEP